MRAPAAGPLRLLGFALDPFRTWVPSPPVGAPAQAWSAGQLLELLHLDLAE